MKIHIFNICWNLFFMVWSAYHMVGHIMNNRQNMATLQACAMVFFGAFMAQAISDMIKHLARHGTETNLNISRRNAMPHELVFWAEENLKTLLQLHGPS